MMEERQRSILLEVASRFPPPPGVKLAYGTAGFRADASILSSTVFRMGILAALRSISTGSAIGLMITASHNQVSDNGVKIADPSGGMMTQDWEPIANDIANAVDAQALVEIITQIMEHEGFRLGGQTAEVLVGRDTRPSGVTLIRAAKQGISAIVGAVSVDVGILTTPQLHWMVRQKNKGLEASEAEYFSQLSRSFRSMVELVSTDRSPDGADGKVTVDGANGIGGEKLEELNKLLEGLIIEVRNTGKGGVLNEGVGADFVQKERVAPSGFDLSDVGKRCASVDGDADRLVYFHVLNTPNKSIALVDGDKILSLFALYVKEQLDILGETDVKLGIVQTAYANGASTDFLKQNGLDVVVTPTGVKYLHEKATEYDIGIYFEANGHGTILFSESFLKCLEQRNSKLLYESSVKQKAALRLLAASKIVNEAVGDALSGLLLVESILQHWGWSINEWSVLYNDLPSSQQKVKVADKNAVTTTNAETRVVNPSGLQDAIDSEVAKYSRGRSFIRPSGTEDIVRVYAEASSEEAADNLAFSVAKHVERFLQ